MTNWMQRIEEKTSLSVADIADDVAQGLALTGIVAVLLAWTVMLLQHM